MLELSVRILASSFDGESEDNKKTFLLGIFFNGIITPFLISYFLATYYYSEK